MPEHTSCGEIGSKVEEGGVQNAVIWLPAEAGFVCGNDTRLRQRVDIEDAVSILESHWDFSDEPKPFSLTPELREWLSWERVAKEFMKLMV